MQRDPFELLQRGVTTIADSWGHDPVALGTRVVLILLGFLFLYLGKRGLIEPLLAVPLGMAMTAGSAAALLVGGPPELVVLLRANAPAYGLILACLLLAGMGALMDVGHFLARPWTSLFLALFAELGTFVTFAAGLALGLRPGDAASFSILAGADGPITLYTALTLASDLFVPVSVVAFLYVGVSTRACPGLVRLLVPKKLLALQHPPAPTRRVTSGERLAFAAAVCTLLSFLFPAAAPLTLSLFAGVAIREASPAPFLSFVQNAFLNGSFVILGLLLGILAGDAVLLDARVGALLILGAFGLLLASLGGILGGYVLFFVTGGRFNPAVGIAAVSVFPATAKAAQKCVTQADATVDILPEAMGASIAGVITTAIIAGLLIAMLR